MDHKEVGEKLKALRAKSGETAAEVAAKVGISTTAMLMYENGHRGARDEVKQALAHHYGVSIGSLFYGE